MTRPTQFLAAVAAIGGVAAPLSAAQYQYQPYPQPVYPQQAYPGYSQGYSTGNPVTDIIDQLLGNRYSVTDRQAVRVCANAARTQASQQYGRYSRNYGQGGYGQGGYGGYNQQFAAPSLRVTAITNVERRSNGLRVSGLMSSSYAGQYGNQYNQRGSQYGGQYAYQNRGYGDVSFRCNVDYRGAVTNVRIGRNGDYRH